MNSSSNKAAGSVEEPPSADGNEQPVKKKGWGWSNWLSGQQQQNKTETQPVVDTATASTSTTVNHVASPTDGDEQSSDTKPLSSKPQHPPSPNAVSPKSAVKTTGKGKKKTNPKKKSPTQQKHKEREEELPSTQPKPLNSFFSTNLVKSIFNQAAIVSTAPSTPPMTDEEELFEQEMREKRKEVQQQTAWYEDELRERQSNSNAVLTNGDHTALKLFDRLDSTKKEEQLTGDELQELFRLANQRKQIQEEEAELEALLERQEMGNDIDTDRLHCLQLLSRQRRGETLDDKEETFIYYVKLERQEEQELADLLSRKDNREEIDESRLYELQLLDRKKNNDNDMSDEELRDAELLDRRREDARQDQQNYKELLGLKDNGEDIDEERFYLLGLVDKQIRNEDLSEDEAQDLNEYYEIRDEVHLDSIELRMLQEKRDKGEVVDDERVLELELLKRKRQGETLSEFEEQALAEFDLRRVQGLLDAEELNVLTEQREKGISIDEERLQELELLQRQRNGDILSKEEHDVLLQAATKRKEQQEQVARLEEEEFQQLLHLKKCGESVDQTRLYELELLHRRRGGEELSEDELMDLELFELQRTEGKSEKDDIAENANDEKEHGDSESISSSSAVGLTPSEREGFDKVRQELQEQGLPMSISFSSPSKQRDKFEMSFVSHGENSYVEDLLNQKENRDEERHEECLEEALELYQVAVQRKNLPDSEALFVSIFEELLKEKRDEWLEKDKKLDQLVEDELKKIELRKKEKSEILEAPDKTVLSEEALDLSTAECKKVEATNKEELHNKIESEEVSSRKVQEGNRLKERLDTAERSPQVFPDDDKKTRKQEQVRGVEEKLEVELEKLSADTKGDEMASQNDIKGESKDHVPQSVLEKGETRGFSSAESGKSLSETEHPLNAKEKHNSEEGDKTSFLTEDVPSAKVISMDEDLEVEGLSGTPEMKRVSANQVVTKLEDGFESTNSALRDVEATDLHVAEDLERKDNKDYALVEEDDNKIRGLCSEAIENIIEMDLHNEAILSTGEGSKLEAAYTIPQDIIGKIRHDSTALESAKLKIEENTKRKLEKQARRQAVEESLLRIGGDEETVESFHPTESVQASVSGVSTGIGKHKGEENSGSENIAISSHEDYDGVVVPENNDTPITLTDGEFGELNQLLDAQERGEPFNEERLYELELLDRHSLGEELSSDEIEDLPFILKRREQFQRYTREYNDLVDKQENGQEVDSDRIYLLELFVRDRLGDVLTDDEFDELARFQVAEEEQLSTGFSELSGTNLLEQHHPGTLLTGEPLTQLDEVEEEELSESESRFSDRPVDNGNAPLLPFSSSEEQDNNHVAEELENLLAMRESGKEVDEQRLYELELLEKCLNGEELSQEEIEDLNFLRERRTRFEVYAREYNELLDKKENVELIDDERLRCLELVVRRHLGESLTDEEFDALEAFEFEEEENKVGETNSERGGASMTPDIVYIASEPPLEESSHWSAEESNNNEIKEETISSIKDPRGAMSTEGSQNKNRDNVSVQACPAINAKDVSKPSIQISDTEAQPVSSCSAWASSPAGPDQQSELPLLDCERSQAIDQVKDYEQSVVSGNTGSEEHNLSEPYLENFEEKKDNFIQQQDWCQAKLSIMDEVGYHDNKSEQFSTSSEDIASDLQGTGDINLVSCASVDVVGENHQDYGNSPGDLAPNNDRTSTITKELTPLDKNAISLGSDGAKTNSHFLMDALTTIDDRKKDHTSMQEDALTSSSFETEVGSKKGKSSANEHRNSHEKQGELLNECSKSHDHSTKENSEMLTESDKIELERLTEKHLNEESFDEEKYYELELLQRYSLGEDLTADELDDIDFIKERRRRAEIYRLEYENMVRKKDFGETIDEEQLYFLELLERRRTGHELTGEEYEDIEDFEADEQFLDEEIEPVESQSVDLSNKQSTINPFDDARKRALDLLNDNLVSPTVKEKVPIPYTDREDKQSIPELENSTLSVVDCEMTTSPASPLVEQENADENVLEGKESPICDAVDPESSHAPDSSLAVAGSAENAQILTKKEGLTEGNGNGITRLLMRANAAGSGNSSGVDRGWRINRLFGFGAKKTEEAPTGSYIDSYSGNNASMEDPKSEDLLLDLTKSENHEHDTSNFDGGKLQDEGNEDAGLANEFQSVTDSNIESSNKSDHLNAFSVSETDSHETLQEKTNFENSAEALDFRDEPSYLDGNDGSSQKKDDTYREREQVTERKGSPCDSTKKSFQQEIHDVSHTCTMEANDENVTPEIELHNENQLIGSSESINEVDSSLKEFIGCSGDLPSTTARLDLSHLDFQVVKEELLPHLRAKNDEATISEATGENDDELLNITINESTRNHALELGENFEVSSKSNDSTQDKPAESSESTPIAQKESSLPKTENEIENETVESAVATDATPIESKEECEESPLNTMKVQLKMEFDVSHLHPPNQEPSNQEVANSTLSTSLESDSVTVHESDQDEKSEYEEDLFRKEQSGEELTDDELFELDKFDKRRNGANLSQDEMDDLALLRQKRKEAIDDEKELVDLKGRLLQGEEVDEERIYELELFLRYRKGDPLNDDELFELDAFDRIRIGEELSPDEEEDMKILREERLAAKHDRKELVNLRSIKESHADEDRLLEHELKDKRRKGEYLSEEDLYTLDVLHKKCSRETVSKADWGDLETLKSQNATLHPSIAGLTAPIITEEDREYLESLRLQLDRGEPLYEEELYHLELLDRVEQGDTLQVNELEELSLLRQQKITTNDCPPHTEKRTGEYEEVTEQEDKSLYEVELCERRDNGETIDENEQWELEIFERQKKGMSLSEEEIVHLNLLEKARKEKKLDKEGLRQLCEQIDRGDEIDENLLYELELFERLRNGNDLSEEELFELDMFQIIREGGMLSEEQVTELEMLRAEREEAVLDKKDMEDLLEQRLRGESIDEDFLYELELFNKKRHGEVLSEDETIEYNLFNRLREGGELLEDDLDELDMLKNRRLGRYNATDPPGDTHKILTEDDEDSIYRRDLLDRQMKGQRLDKQEFQWLELLQKKNRQECLLEDELDELEILRRQRKETNVEVEQTRKLLEKEVHKKMKREMRELRKKEKADRKEQRRQEKERQREEKELLPKVKKMRRKKKERKDDNPKTIEKRDTELTKDGPSSAKDEDHVKPSTENQDQTVETPIETPPLSKPESQKKGIFGGVFGRKKKSKKELELEEAKRRQEELIKEHMKALALEEELKELEREKELQEQLVQETIDKKAMEDEGSRGSSSWETDTAEEIEASDDDISSVDSSSSESDSDSSIVTLESTNFEAANTFDGQAGHLSREGASSGKCNAQRQEIGSRLRNSISRRLAAREQNNDNNAHKISVPKEIFSPAPISAPILSGPDSEDASVATTGSPAAIADNTSLGSKKRDKSANNKVFSLSAHLLKKKKKRGSRRNKTKYGDELSLGTAQLTKINKNGTNEDFVLDIDGNNLSRDSTAKSAGRNGRPWMSGEEAVDLGRFATVESTIPVEKKQTPKEGAKVFDDTNHDVFDRSVFHFNQSFASKISLLLDEEGSRRSMSESGSIGSGMLTKAETNNDSNHQDTTDEERSMLESLGSSLATLEVEEYIFETPDYENIESRLAAKLKSKEAEFDAAWENIVADQHVAAQINQRLRERQRVKETSSKKGKKEVTNGYYDVPRLYLFEGEKLETKKKKKKRKKKKDRKLYKKLDKTLSKEFRKAMREVFNSDSEEEYDKTFGERDGNRENENDAQSLENRSRVSHRYSDHSMYRNGSAKSLNASESVATEDSDEFDGGYLQRLKSRSTQQEVRQMLFESRRQLMAASKHSEMSSDNDDNFSQNSELSYSEQRGNLSTRDNRYRRKAKKPKKNRNGEIVVEGIDPAEVYAKELEKQKQKKKFTIADLRKEMEELKQPSFGSFENKAASINKLKPPKQKKPKSSVGLAGPGSLPSQRPGLENNRLQSFTTAASDQGLLTGAMKVMGTGLGMQPHTIEEGEEEEEEEAFLTGGREKSGDFDDGFNDSKESAGFGFGGNRFSNFNFFGAGAAFSKSPGKPSKKPTFGSSFGGFGGGKENQQLGGLPSSTPISTDGFQEPLPLPEMNDDDLSRSKGGSKIASMMGRSMKLFSKLKLPGKRNTGGDHGGGFMMDDDDEPDEGGMGLLGS